MLIPFFIASRKSSVPEGGWTQETFQSRRGVELLRDMERVQKAEKARGLRLLAPPLARLMKSQVEAVLSRFERNARTYGVKAVISVTDHADLWADALRSVLGPEADVQVINTVTPPLQSIASTVHEKTNILLTDTKPSPASRRVLQTRVGELAQDVTSINETTRSRLSATIQRGIDAGDHPFEVMKQVRNRIPEIATNRVPTIVRTEMGRAADAATIRSMKDSEVVTHVSVMGCEAVEPGIPTFRGVPTCNIKNVPIAYSGDLRFHPNHTGSIVASAFRKQDGTAPPDPGLRPGNGSGTWEDGGSPVPALVPEPPPGEPVAPQLPDAYQIVPPGRRPVGHLGMRQTPQDAELDAMLRRAEDTLVRMQGTGTPQEITAAFVEDFRTEPAAIAERLSRGLKAGLPNHEIRTAFTRQDDGWKLRMTARAEGARASDVLVERTLNMGTGVVTHDLFELKPAIQGQGLAKAVLSDQLDVYDHLGMRKILLDANIDIGGYAWARYGFLPASRAEWDALRTIMHERLVDMEDGGLIDALADRQVDAVQRLLESPERRSIRALASLRAPIGDGRPLGRALLQNSYWRGELDLTAPDDYAAFAAHLGR